VTADPQLSWAEQETALRRRLADLTPRLPPQRGPGGRPWAVLIGGQQAAGKTTTQGLVHDALGRDNVASYDGDDNATVHPRHVEIMRQNGIHGQAIVANILPSGLHFASLQHLRAGEPKYDVVASHPLQQEDWAKQWVDGFRDNGYRVSVVYIATNESNSLLGIANRYQQGRDDEGIGRWVDPAWHDQSYHGVPATAHALESQAYVDDIYVVNRDGQVLYENHRNPDGTMERAPGAAQAIVDERNRPPTPAERDQFTRIASNLRDGRESMLPPLEYDVREVVDEAERREFARPEPRPDTRQFPAENRIDHRLGRGGPSGPGAGPPGGPAGGPGTPPSAPARAGDAAGSAPASIDPALLEAQRLAGAGVAAPRATSPASLGHGAANRSHPDGRGSPDRGPAR
jgi:hypothetical protein